MMNQDWDNVTTDTQSGRKPQATFVEMAYGNVDKMKSYEDKAIAIDPKAFRNTKN